MRFEHADRTVLLPRWATVVAVVLFTGCAPAPVDDDTRDIPTALTEADVDAIRTLSQAYGQAWVADDTTAVLDLFSPDAVLIPHLGNPHVEGRDAIRDHFYPVGQAPVEVISMDRISAGVSGMGDLAWDRGTYETVMVFDGDTLRNSGNYVAVARRQASGRWAWEAYTWNHR